MRYFIDRESGYMLPVPAYIDVASGMMVQRFDPRDDEIPCEGQVLSKSDYPGLWEKFEKAGVLKLAGEDSFVIPDIRGRYVGNKEGLI